MNSKERKKLIRVWLGNLAMFFSIIAIVAILVFMIQGWSLTSGTVQQTGLVQFGSRPTGATVEVGQNTLYARTNTRANVLPGEHEFNVWREGYETWYRKTDVSAGQILWLNYIRLIPREKIVQEVVDFESLEQIIPFSRNQRLLAYSSAEEGQLLGNFSVVDIRSDSPTTQGLSLPENIFFSEDELADFYSLADSGADLSDISRPRIVIDEISSDGSWAIIRKISSDQTEWILANLSSPESSRNLTRDFNLEFDEVKLASNNASTIIAQTGGDLRQLNSRNQTISATLVGNVVGFEVFNNDVIGFVQQDSDDLFNVGVLNLGQTPVLVEEGFTSQPKVALSRYYNESYVHILDENELRILKSSNWPDSTNNFRLHTSLGISLDETQNLSTNSEGRFIVANSSDNMQIYDLEIQRSYNLNLDQRLSANQKVSWLDNFILYDFSEGELTMRDFDGSNKHPLMAADSNFPAILSSNGRYIYAIQTDPESNQNQLVQLQMILN